MHCYQNLICKCFETYMYVHYTHIHIGKHGIINIHVKYKRICYPVFTLAKTKIWLQFKIILPKHEHRSSACTLLQVQKMKFISLTNVLGIHSKLSNDPPPPCHPRVCRSLSDKNGKLTHFLLTPPPARYSAELRAYIRTPPPRASNYNFSQSQ